MNDKRQKPVKISPIDQDILTVLKAQGELYGLKILDVLNLDREEKLGNQLGFGTLYPSLNRLEKKGLIDWRWGEETEESGGARRKYYRINGLGERSLRAVEQYRAGLAGNFGLGHIGLRGV